MHERTLLCVSDDLLPCPFCGSTDLLYDEDTRLEACAVACRGCGGEGGAGYNRTEAAAAWNRRTPTSAGCDEVSSHGPRKDVPEGGHQTLTTAERRKRMSEDEAWWAAHEPADRRGSDQ